MRFWFKLLSVIGLATTALPARAEWLEASNKHFVVLGDSSRAEIKKFADELALFDAAVRKVANLRDDEASPRNRLTIFLVAGDGAVNDLHGRSGGNIGGFYQARASGSIAVVPQLFVSRFVTIDPRMVLYHEYAHHLILGSTNGIYPVWVSEGLAEFFTYTKSYSDGAVLLGLPNVARSDQITQSSYPVRSLLDEQHKRATQVSVEARYSRGWLLIHYLFLGGKRPGQFDSYMRLINEGVPGLRAGEKAFGDLNQLDDELNRYRRTTLPHITLPPGGAQPDPVTLRALSPAEAAAMPAYVRLKASLHGNAASTQRDAAGLAARFPDSGFVQRLLASAALAAGDGDTAVAAADRALAIDATDVEALLVKARVAIDRAAKAGDASGIGIARGLIARAAQLDPDYAQTHVLRFMSYRAMGAAPIPAAVAGLKRATELVPQARAPLALYAGEMIREGNLPEARLALIPLAFSPHAPANNGAAALLGLIDDGADAETVRERAATLAKDPAEDDAR